MKLVFSFLCILFLVPAFSQIRFGFEAGYSRSAFNKDDVSAFEYRRKTSPLTAGHAGLTSSVSLSNHFFLRPSLFLTGKGSHKNESNGFNGYSSQSDIRLWYAEIPVNVLYSFANFKSLQLLIGTGAYVSLGLWGRERGFGTSHDSLGMPGIYMGVRKVRFINGLSDNGYGQTIVKPIDAGGNLLLQAELKNVFLKVSYSYGITKVINPNYRNRIFSLSAGCFLNNYKRHR